MSRVLSVISTETHHLQITKKLSTRYITTYYAIAIHGLVSPGNNNSLSVLILDLSCG